MVALKVFLEDKGKLEAQNADQRSRARLFQLRAMLCNFPGQKGEKKTAGKKGGGPFNLYGYRPKRAGFWGFCGWWGFFFCHLKAAARNVEVPVPPGKGETKYRNKGRGKGDETNRSQGRGRLPPEARAVF